MRGEWSPEVGRGDSKHPSLPLARAERKPFGRKKNIPRATSARTSLKKKPALPLARAERKPFDRKKNIPRATSARTSLKKKPALPLARAERKPFDRKNKIRPAPARAAATPFYVFTQNIAVCVFNAQATSANCISQICHFDRHYF